MFFFIFLFLYIYILCMCFMAPHVNIHRFITLVFGEDYNLIFFFFSSLCYCHIGPDLLNFPSENTLSLCSSSNFRDRVPRQYRTTGWGVYFSGVLCGLGWYMVIKIFRLFAGPFCQGQALKMVATCCPEILVTNCQSILSNTPEDWRPHLHCSGSMKSYRTTGYYNIYAFR
jgi:hypothetical protein